MNKTHRSVVIICLLVISLLAISMAISSCSPEQSSGQKFTPTPIPTSTPKSTVTNILASKSSSAPTRPLTPTFTQTPIPLASWCPVQELAIASSNGKLSIAYISKKSDDNWRKDAWLWTEDASPIRLTTWGDLDWIDASDDGMYVAFTRQIVQNRNVELWIIRSDGSDERLLVTSLQFAEMHKGSTAIPTDLHWVPGTHIIAFHTNPAVDEFGFVYTPDNLWWVDAESGQFSEKPVDGEVFYSPDGKRAAVVNQRYLFLMNSDGSNQRIVTLENYHTIPVEAAYKEPPRVHWANDSMSFYVIAPESKDIFEALAPAAWVSIWQINFDDAQPKKVGNYNAVYTPITFSPDHKFVTYFHPQNEFNDYGDLHLTQIGGLEDIVIYSSGVTYASWSPDSQHYIFEDSGMLYLGHICKRPLALLNEPLIGRDGVIVNGWVIWMDAYQYILVSGDHQLYLGRIDQSEQPQKLLEDDVTTFDWVVVR